MIEGEFAPRLLTWFDQHGRHDLPWQHPRSLYRVWVSEVMLQQTQVRTVIDYFARFMARFPSLAELAAAEVSEVLALWAGLGYYSRARNLHAAAQRCVRDFGAELPHDIDQLQSLPGIGRSTAAAILAQSQGLRHAILDGNVMRVLARLDAIEAPIDASATRATLWTRSEQLLPQHRIADYTQALMDFGATWCSPRQPRCDDCPMSDLCRARQLGLSTSIPQRSARKSVPVRSLYWLLMRDEAGRILLERRPDHGIWGGLLALPELLEPDNALAAASQFGVAIARVQRLPPVRHRFTHFQLLATPLLIDLRAGESVAERPVHWLKPSELQAREISTPLRRLIERIASTGSGNTALAASQVKKKTPR